MSASKQFGRYQIVKHLATGGMAEVLLATATGIEGFERHVVIKQIDPHFSKNPMFVQMFLDEARLAASLHHHNIVQVHDIGKEGDTFFFAMEYIHGEDLRKVLSKISARKEKTPLEHAITIITAAASALHYAHEHRGPDRKPLNVVHRDVSPSNILIGFDGNVKVVDFGIAKTAMATTETRAGDIKGKFSHMSPEQCLGKTVDRRSDVFALGIVLFELVTVRGLFRGDSDFAKMKAIVEGTTQRPSKYRPDLPPELDEIILKALARDPANRYQTADELRVALERFAIMNNLRSSTTALADYVNQLFGKRPEPWLASGWLPIIPVQAPVALPVEVPVEVPVVVPVEVPVEVAVEVPVVVPVVVPVEVAVEKRRQKPISEGYADIIVVAGSSQERSDPSGSKTSMAWSPVQAPPATAPSKWRLPLLAAALAVPLAMMGVVAVRLSSNIEPAHVVPETATRSTAATRSRAASQVASATRSDAVVAAAAPASIIGSRVSASTHPGEVAPGATSTANTRATPTANTGSGVATATQPGIEEPVAAASTAPTAPPPATAPVTSTQLLAATAEPVIAKKPTVRPAKSVAKTKRPAKQPAWDPDALTPE